jgi:type VII secretion-associated serine protease mycosin
MLGRTVVAARTVVVACRVVVACAVALGAGAAVAAGAAPAEAAPSDQIRDSQDWALNMLDMEAAWGISQGAGVTVAVIDSGVNPYASDLTGSVTTGPDLTGLSTSPGNSEWGVHGTWMASIIAGHGHDGGGSGIIGIAPEAKVLAIRVIPDKGDPGYHAYDSEKEQHIQQSLATGITDATRDGAKVISMSIGYSAPSSAVRAALQYAEQHGVVMVASSGNSGQDDQQHSHGFAPVSFPAEYPGVLSVAAVNADGAVASFSSDNLSVQVAAPGVNVPAEGRDGNYWLVSGTSPACALVAGVAALIKSRYPGLSPVLVDQALTSTAHAGTANGYNAKTGFGTVDAAAALRAAGELAAQRPGTSPEAASAHFGGGPAAIPPAPIAPRGPGQVILFSLLGLAAFGLTIGSGLRLAAGRRRAPVTAERTLPVPHSAGPFPEAPQYSPSPYPPSPYPASQYPEPSYPPGQYPPSPYPAPPYPPRGYPAGRRYPAPEPPSTGQYPPPANQQPGASQYRDQEQYPAWPEYPARDDHPGQPPSASRPDWMPPQ